MIGRENQSPRPTCEPLWPRCWFTVGRDPLAGKWSAQTGDDRCESAHPKNRHFYLDNGSAGCQFDPSNIDFPGERDATLAQARKAQARRLRQHATIR